MNLATRFLCICAVTLLAVHVVISAGDKIGFETLDDDCTGNLYKAPLEGAFDLKTNTVVNKKYKVGNLSELCKCKIYIRYDIATEEIDYIFCRHKVGDEMHWSALNRTTMLMVDNGKVLF